MLSVTVLVGLILAIGYIIFLRATLRSIGMFGMLFGAGRCWNSALGVV